MLNFRHLDTPVSLAPGSLWKPGAAAADTYRDAPSQEVEGIIRDVRNGMPWREAVSRRYAKSNPWLNNIVTSPRRDLFFRNHPPAPGARILDIGAGWGQTSIPLARSAAAEVVAIEPTPERLAFIEAAARQEGCAEKMSFVQADFLDVTFGPAFDLICCIGVLEWAPRFRSGDPRTVQLEFLRHARSSLADGGRMVIGIENRLGLKYLLGAPDDHIGAPGVAVYDAALASAKWRSQSGQELRSFTFTRAELAALLAEAGFSRMDFHAAIPDYKLPQLILPLGPETDRHFAGDNIIPEHDGCSGKPVPFQAELRSHYRSLAALGIASDFVPSFFVVAGIA